MTISRVANCLPVPCTHYVPKAQPQRRRVREPCPTTAKNEERNLNSQEETTGLIGDQASGIAGSDGGSDIAGSDGGSGIAGSNGGSGITRSDGGSGNILIFTPELDGGPTLGSGPCGGSEGNAIFNYKLGGEFRIGILDRDDVRGSGDIATFTPELDGGSAFGSGPGGGPCNVAVDPGFGDEPDGGSSDTDSCDCEEYCEELSGEHHRWRVKSGGWGR
jgi:hypothetical protein